MNILKKLGLGVAFFAGLVLSASILADDSAHGHAIDADDFVEEASAKGLAEIETSRLALEKSTSAEVRKFAQTMIDDHTKANQELSALARTKKLDIADDVELMNKAKASILKQRDGESFDEAYVNNQVVAHEKTVELFQKATHLKDADLKSFAQTTLPKLQHHLQMAQQLQQTQKTIKRAAEDAKEKRKSE